MKRAYPQVSPTPQPWQLQKKSRLDTSSFLPPPFYDMTSVHPLGNLNGVGFPLNGNGFPLNGNGFPLNGNGFPLNGNGFPLNNGRGFPLNNGRGFPLNGKGFPLNLGKGFPLNRMRFTPRERLGRGLVIGMGQLEKNRSRGRGKRIMADFSLLPPRNNDTEALPREWLRSGSGLPPPEWYNDINPTNIGMGGPHPAPGINDLAWTKGIPYTVNFPDFNTNYQVDNKLGSSRVNPTYQGYGGYLMAPSQPNRTYGTTHTEYDPIYGVDATLPRIFNPYSGNINLGFGLEDPCILYSINESAGGGIFDWLKSLFAKKPTQWNPTPTPDDWTFLPAIPAHMQKAVDNRKKDKLYQNSLNDSAKAVQSLIGKPSTNGGITDALKKTILDGTKEATTSTSNDSYMKQLWSWAANTASKNWLGHGAIMDVYDHLGRGVGGELSELSTYQNRDFLPHMLGHIEQNGYGCSNYDEMIGEGLRDYQAGVRQRPSGGFLDALWDITKKISPAGMIFKAITGREFGSGVGDDAGGFLDMLWDITKKISPAGLIFKAVTGREFGSGQEGGLWAEIGATVAPDVLNEIKNLFGLGIDEVSYGGAGWMNIGKTVAPNILGEFKKIFGMGDAIDICVPTYTLFGSGPNGRKAIYGHLGYGPVVRNIYHNLKVGGNIDDYDMLTDAATSVQNVGSWSQRLREYLSPQNIAHLAQTLPGNIMGFLKSPALQKFLQSKDPKDAIQLMFEELARHSGQTEKKPPIPDEWVDLGEKGDKKTEQKYHKQWAEGQGVVGRGMSGSYMGVPWRKIYKKIETGSGVNLEGVHPSLVPPDIKKAIIRQKKKKGYGGADVGVQMNPNLTGTKGTANQITSKYGTTVYRDAINLPSIETQVKGDAPQINSMSQGLKPNMLFKNYTNPVYNTNAHSLMNKNSPGDGVGGFINTGFFQFLKDKGSDALDVLANLFGEKEPESVLDKMTKYPKRYGERLWHGMKNPKYKHKVQDVFKKFLGSGFNDIKTNRSLYHNIGMGCVHDKLVILS